MQDNITKSTQSIGFSFLIIMVFLGSQMLVGNIAKLVKGPLYVEQHMYLLTFMAYIIVIISMVCINNYQKDTIRAHYKGFTKKMLGQTLTYMIPLWLIVTFVNGLLYPFFPQYDAQVDSLFVSSEPVLRFIVLVLGAPFIEEYLFREKIQTFVKKRFGTTVAILFQGMLFGIIHPFGLQKIYASVMGIGLGWMKEKTNHILSPTLIHILINGVGFMAGLVGA